MREEGECPPLAAAAASPFVTSSVCPTHVVAAAASSARTPGARPAPPGAAAAPRGDGRRPRPALPCLPVCPSIRLSARPRFRPSVGPSALRPVSPLRPLCLFLARCLFVSALALSAPPSLRGSRVPFPSAPLLSHSHGFWHPHSSGHPLRSFGGLSFRTRSTPPGLLSLPHILWGSSLIPLLLILGGCLHLLHISPGVSHFSGASNISARTFYIP